MWTGNLLLKEYSKERKKIPRKITVTTSFDLTTPPITLLSAGLATLYIFVPQKYNCYDNVFFFCSLFIYYL